MNEKKFSFLNPNNYQVFLLFLILSFESLYINTESIISKHNFDEIENRYPVCSFVSWYKFTQRTSENNLNFSSCFPDVK
jgi:hypothetical protein